MKSQRETLLQLSVWELEVSEGDTAPTQREGACSLRERQRLLQLSVWEHAVSERDRETAPPQREGACSLREKTFLHLSLREYVVHWEKDYCTYCTHPMRPQH